MTPPKRPFTTSSLTSTLKSTIASQPLLSNLTNIDKLSSQASSLAQKAPFFGALNQQFQQHINPQNSNNHNQTTTTTHVDTNNSTTTATTTSSGGTQSNSSNFAAESDTSNMMRAGGPNQPQPSKAGAASAGLATTPTVDMSHLTEEERLMIQSVMAKAEMADMGMPVDTSIPSSTNLPSSTSQALSQQTRDHQQMRLQQQQQQQIQQQQQQSNQKLMNMNSSNQQQNINMIQGQQQFMQQQQQQPNQQVQNIYGGATDMAGQGQMGGNLIGNNNMGPNSMGQQGMQQHQQSQQQQMHHQQSLQDPNLQLQRQQQAQQQMFQPPTSVQNQSNMMGGNMMDFNSQRQANMQQQQSMMDAKNNLPSLNQQTSQLISQINSQFKLGGSDQGNPTPQQQQHTNAANPSNMMMPQQPFSSNTQQNQQSLHQQQLPHGNSMNTMNQLHQQQPQIQNQNNLTSGNRFNVQAPVSQAMSLNNSTNLMHAPLQQQMVSINQTSNQQQSLDSHTQQQLPMQQSQAQQSIMQQQPISQLNQQALNQHDPIAQRQPQNIVGANFQQQPSGVINGMTAPNQIDSMGLSPADASSLQMMYIQHQQQQHHHHQQPQPQSNSLMQAPQVGLTRQPNATSPSQITVQTSIANTDANTSHMSSMPLTNDHRRQVYSQQHDVGSLTGPEHVYDARNDIRFGQRNILFETDLENAANSDQEYHNGRVLRHHQNQNNQHILGRTDSADARTSNVRSMKRHDLISSRSVAERELQAYDLASYKGGQSYRQGRSRQLPNPNPLAERSLQSSSEHIQDIRSDSAGGKGPVGQHSGKRIQHQRTIEGKQQQQRQNIPDSPILSGSEPEDFYDEDIGRPSKTIVNAKKKPGQADKIEQVSGDNTKNETENASNKAIQLLSELKLNEQATQVMEQQQLLIKQSQELIKLQLEQQALSQELKKSIKNTETKSGSEDQTNKDIGSTVVKEINGDVHQDVTPVQSGPDEETVSGTETLTSPRTTKDKPEKFVLNNKSTTSESNTQATRLKSSKKSTSFQNESRDSDHDSEYTPKYVSKSSSTHVDDLNDDEDRYSDYKSSKASGRDSKVVKRQPGVSNSSSQTCPSPRFTRDPLQSPTDTTDSDVELISSNRARHLKYQQQQSHQSRLRNQTPKRREPTGLPPSPLPVSAAIQLHQMQQQHLRQAMRNTVTRNNFMRSRSVTNSPNHLLERGNNGYLTDNQRIRSVSPDTLSEFGGLRRRKRLPDPPSNAVPLTPSMVRKMIQAQRAAAANLSSGKLLTSVNAQTTLMANTHSNNARHLTFERPLINEQANTSYLSSKSVDATKNALLQGPSSSDQMTRIHADSKATLLNKQARNPAKSGNLDLGKFLSSTYGDSVLRSDINDINETPELDKLISNLDDYYGLDSSRGNSRPVDSLHLSGMESSSELATNIPSSSRYNQDVQSAAGYPNYSRSLPSSGRYPMLRYNSEGCSNQLPRSTHMSRPNLVRSSSPFDDFRSASGGGDGGLISQQYSSYAFDRTSHQPYVSPFAQSRSIGTRYHTGRSLQPSAHHNANSIDGARPVDQYNSRSSANERGPFTVGFSSSEVFGGQSSGGLASIKYTSGVGPNLDTNMQDSMRQRFLGDYNRISSPVRLQGSGRTSDLMHSRTTAGRAPMLSHDSSRSYQYGSLDLDRSRGNAPPQSKQPYATNYRQYPGSGPYSSFDPTTEASDYRYQLNTPAYSGTENYPSSFSRNQGERYANKSALNLESGSRFAPLTKDDIIRNGPKFNSIGYRFGTENQNKYVTQARTPLPSLQSRYPHPYKRILLSKNPKDRLGNGIGVRIIGGQPLPSIYDKVNRCIINSGAFVTEVFQTSNVHFMGEVREGDQIIEWNGVNLCNRSNEEVQQILLSQFSDDEVEIVYLNQEKFNEAYNFDQETKNPDYNSSHERDLFDAYADVNAAQNFANNRIGSRYHQVSSDYSGSKSGSIRRKLSLSSLTQMWSK